MGVTLERWFERGHDGLVQAVQAAGPCAMPMLFLIALLFVVTFRDRIISPGGVIFVLAALAFALIVRAVQLGRF